MNLQEDEHFIAFKAKVDECCIKHKIPADKIEEVRLSATQAWREAGMINLMLSGEMEICGISHDGTLLWKSI